MRRYVKYLVAALVAVITVTAILAMRRIPQTLPPEPCSELFRHYSAVDGVECSCFGAFMVNDTLTVPVTLLEAQDSMGWELLKNDFNIYEQTEEEIRNYEITFPNDQITLMEKACPRGKYNQEPRADNNDNEMVFINRTDRYLMVIHTSNNKQFEAIQWMYLDWSVTQTNIIENFNINNHVEKN
jgi:hypothetical protein